MMMTILTHTEIWDPAHPPICYLCQEPITQVPYRQHAGGEAMHAECWAEEERLGA